MSRARWAAVAAAGLAAVLLSRPMAAVPAPHPDPSPADDDWTPYPAPELKGATDWVNTKAVTMADLKGKVVAVHFWTNGCINCVHNYPHYRAWQEKYKEKEKDFVLLGVHTPEFDAEKSVDRIKERMTKNKLTFAVAVDNDLAVWKAWQNRYWPAVYLVDRAGQVRWRWEGELGDGGYKDLTKRIDGLLAEAAPKK